MSAYAPSIHNDELHACPYCGSPARLVEKACIEEQGGHVYTGYAVACTNDNQATYRSLSIPACSLSKIEEFEFTRSPSAEDAVTYWTEFSIYTEITKHERHMALLGNLDPKDKSDYEDLLIVINIAQRHARKLLTRKKS